MTAAPSATTLPPEVFDHLMDGILLVSEGRVLAASSQASEVLELSQSRLLGASLDDLLSDSLDEAFERLVEGAASVTLRGLPWKRLGRRGQVTVSVTRGPQPGQFVVQLRDESDPSGQEAADGFRRRLTWLDSLAAGIAHEIRNPLGGIRGAAQLLQRSPTPAESDELTQMIVVESDRIDRMVEQLMELTRPRTLERSDVDVNGLIHEEVALLRAQFGSEQVDWQLDLDPSLPTVEGDRLRLREAVGNLLRNAREAAESTVIVKTRIEAGERLTEDGFDRGQSLHLEIRDDGPGIAESDANSIFAPFSTTKPEGSGLGLFVTRQVVDDHGARLSLDSVPGQGALFRLSLHERLAPAGPVNAQTALPADFHFGRPDTSPLPPSQEAPR